MLNSHLFDQVQGLTELKLTLEMREIAEPGSYHRGYAFLRSAVDRIVNRRREKSCRDAVLETQKLNAAGTVQALPSKEVHAKEKAAKDAIAKKAKSGSTARASSEPAERNIAAPAGEKLGCWDFLQKGSCKYGDKCKFSHDKSAKSGKGKGNGKGKDKGKSGSGKGGSQPSSKPNSKPASNAGSPRQTPPASPRIGTCFHYAKGKCGRGDKCKFQHVEPAAIARVLLKAVPAATRQ